MFKGTGTLEKMVKDADSIIAAVNSGVVELPPGATGEPTLKIEGQGKDAKLVLDLSDAPVFSLSNMDVDFGFGYLVESMTIKVNGNSLVIELVV